VRYILLILALAGIVVSSLALREHYREGESPCSINDKWDCGIVNKSEYAVIAGVPVAAIGIAGYLLMGVLGVMRRYRLLMLCLVGALGFSAWLSYVEDRILGVWCIYCVISAGIVVVMTVLNGGAVIAEFVRGKRERVAA
jgi:uncharacterized membrane protein